MPDLGEWLLLALLASGAALIVAWPFLGRRSAERAVEDPELETLSLRHRVALESLRDVEADYRAGSLDEAGYARQRVAAEERAAQSLAALEAAQQTPVRQAAPANLGPVIWIGTVLLGLLLVGFALPRPVGLGEATATDQAAAAAAEREAQRQAEIDRLLTLLGDDPSDTEVLSDLADAYLAGGTADDRSRAAVALLAVIQLDPDNASAHRRLIAAYLNAGDWTDARAAIDAYARIAGHDDPDVAFYRGLLALWADEDPDAAVRHFDRFLELAPDDRRASMVRSLRAEAAGDLPD